MYKDQTLICQSSEKVNLPLMLEFHDMNLSRWKKSNIYNYQNDLSKTEQDYPQII